MMVQKKTVFWLFFFLLNVILAQTSTLKRQGTCTPSSAGNGSVDDVPAISKALSTCGDGGTIIIPAGQTFAIRSPLDFSNCHACNFQIDGTLKVSDDLDYWEGKSAFFLVSNVVGATFHSLTGSGLIDGSGQKYWDYFASHKTYRRPYLVQVSNSFNTVFTNIKLKNAPMFFIALTGDSSNITFSELDLSAVSTSENPPANTDGIDPGDSSHITIRNVHIRNGDDCVAFKNGSSNIIVNNITCIGSHGLSIGSLGSKSGGSYIVQNIYVSNATMINCSAATRIKFFPGGPSHGTVFVSNVTYKDITVDNCDYALQVDNCYESTSDTCKQNPSSAKLLDIRLLDIKGKTSKKYDPVVARIDCAPDGTCDLAFTQWDITAPSRRSTVLCSHYDHPSGIKCTPERTNKS
jgi:galacturan 1,4-alpha-galacturonidase